MTTKTVSNFNFVARTVDEIKAQMEAYKKAGGLFDFRPADLVEYLEWKDALEFLNEDAQRDKDDPKAESDWNLNRKDTSDKDGIIKVISDYLAFAWDKANGQRGISAGRSMNHYSVWFWLLGDDAKIVDDFNNYQYYGKPYLVEITKFLELNPDDYDDGERSN